VARAGDLDGDDVAETLIWASGSIDIHPQIFAFSSKGTKQRLKIFGGTTCASIKSLGLLCDIDKDGIDDFYVASDRESATWPKSGFIGVFSGKTGAILAERHGARSCDHLGIAAASIGDLDHDDIRDILVSKFPSDEDATHGPPFSARAPIPTSVVALSGRSLAELYTVAAPISDMRFGWSIEALTDRDGDGIQEFAVGAPGPGDLMSSPHGSFVSIFSGSKGKLLSTIEGRNKECFGTAIVGSIDMSADGICDILIGAPYAEAGRGSVYCYSGKDLAQIRCMSGAKDDLEFGSSIIALRSGLSAGHAPPIIVVGSGKEDAGVAFERVEAFTGEAFECCYEITVDESGSLTTASKKAR
jgi:hypothetical protein